jgi:protein-S-isoprenylcysteine O-methyltransferase Ste14
LHPLEAGLSTNTLTVGTFLFSRITSEDGRDSRFDEIRKSPPKFLGAFCAQATWVSLCLLPVLAVNSIPATTLSALPFLTLTDVIGVALFVGGLSFEATADKQKSQWMEEKKNKKHNEDFLTRGLWSKSRHPNYFGESTLWTGIATVAAGVLVTNVGQSGMGFSGSLGARLGALAMAGVSPAFVTFLLLKVCFQNVLTSRFSSTNSLTRFRVFLSARPSTTSVMVTARTTSNGRRYVLYVLIIG